MSQYSFTLEGEDVGQFSLPRRSIRGLSDQSDVVVQGDGILRPKFVPHQRDVISHADARAIDANGGHRIRAVPNQFGQDMLTQYDHNRRCRYMKDVFDDLPALFFDKNQREYMQAYVEDYRMPFHFFVAVRFHDLPFSNTNTDEYLFTTSNDSEYQRLKFGYNSVDGDRTQNDIRVRLYNEYDGTQLEVNGSNDQTENDHSTITDGLHIFSVLFNGSDSHVRVDGENILEGDIGEISHSQDKATVKDVYIGGEQTNRNVSAEVLEYILFQSDMTGYESQIESYLDRQTNALTGGV